MIPSLSVLVAIILVRSGAGDGGARAVCELSFSFAQWLSLPPEGWCSSHDAGAEALSVGSEITPFLVCAPSSPSNGPCTQSGIALGVRVWSVYQVWARVHTGWSWHQSKLSSVPQSYCDPMVCSTPGLPVHCQILELAQTHLH